MSQDFKSQLEAFVNEAAEKSVNRNMLELHEADARVRHFKQGCEFLMPLIDELIEIRNSYVEHCAHGPYRTGILIEKNNKDLLNILKGEGK